MLIITKLKVQLSILGCYSMFLSMLLLIQKLLNIVKEEKTKYSNKKRLQ